MDTRFGGGAGENNHVVVITLPPALLLAGARSGIKWGGNRYSGRCVMGAQINLQDLLADICHGT